MGGKASNATSTVAILAITVAALYFGRDVLLPIALAVLLSFVLAPLVKLFQNFYLPRTAAVLLTVAIGFSVISGFAALMFTQVSDLAQHLPQYQSTLSQKISTFRGATTASGTLKQASQVLDNLRKQLERPDAEATAVPPASSGRPIPVEVHQPNPGTLQTLSELISPLIHPLATTGIIIIFVIFILVQQQDLRGRLVRLAGSHDLQRTTVAMDDAGKRLSRLFLTQLALNACFGLIIGLGLWLIGVPSAPLWGFLGVILRFVPYIGAVASAIFPLILATAVEPGWSMTMLTAGLFVVVELLVGQIAEPLAYGHSSGLSPVAVIISATFWTWLWGPLGLILATPLTVCLVVAGRHIDRLQFIEILLGDEPALSPSQIAYQRLLAGDPIEATEQARAVLKQGSFADYYEAVLLSALRLAWADARRGLLEPEQLQRISDTSREVIDELEPDEGEQRAESASVVISGKSGTSSDLGSGSNGRMVLCIPGFGHLDEAVALAIAQLLRCGGILARAQENDILSMTKLFALETEDVDLICLCYLEGTTPAQQNYAIRRLRRKAPKTAIMLVLLGEIDQSPDTEGAELFDGVKRVEGTLISVVDRIRDFMLHIRSANEIRRASDNSLQHIG